MLKLQKWLNGILVEINTLTCFWFCCITLLQMKFMLMQKLSNFLWIIANNIIPFLHITRHWFLLASDPYQKSDGSITQHWAFQSDTELLYSALVK